jgi:multidrug efflux pump subunit AcrA (membrane-fusion protein)
VEEGPATAPTRWAAVARPEDRSILEAPAVARVAADASGNVAVTARSRVVRVHARPGSVVEAGDPVVDVAPPELLDAAAAYLGAGRRLQVHAARRDRLEALREEGLVNREQVFAQRAAAAELRAARDEAAATLRAAGVDPRRAAALVRRGHLTLEAPVGGVVTELNARVGEIREPGGAPFARIVGTAPARIEVRTTEPWPEAAQLRFETTAGRLVPLRPTPLATVVDPDDGTRVSWYAPREEVRLPEGLRGVARLTASAEVWEVPVDAVTQRTGESVLVRRRDGAVADVVVEVLSASGATALVHGPLREGDEVAADVAAYRAARGGEGGDEAP